MVEKQANEPVEANEAVEFDSNDPFEVLRNADRFEEQERESERQFKVEDSKWLPAQAAGEETVEEVLKTPDAPVPGADAPVAEVAKSFKFAGKEYTGEELVSEFADPQKILDLLTTREQYKNLNKKHAEVMEEYKAAKLKGEVVEAVKEALPRAPSGSPADPKEVIETARRQLQPVVSHWVKQGIIDQDTVDAIPDVVTILAYQQAEYMRKANEIDRVYREEIVPIVNYARELRQTGQQQGVVAALDSTLNRVQGRGGVYATLSNPDVKAGFVQHLSELNPEVDVLFSDKADDFVARQFIAFNSEQLMSLYDQANKQAVPRQANAARASGAGSSPRPGRAEDSNVDIKRVLFAKG